MIDILILIVWVIAPPIVAEIITKIIKNKYLKYTLAPVIWILIVVFLYFRVGNSSRGFIDLSGSVQWIILIYGLIELFFIVWQNIVLRAIEKAKHKENKELNQDESNCE